MLKIDMHSHIIPKKMPNWTEKFGYGKFIHLEHNLDNSANMIQGGNFFRRIEENSWNEKQRITEYEKFNTQVQVVCTIPVLFSYWAKPKDCLELSEFLNDHIAELIQHYPKNYIGLATIPMQDSERAIKELERAKKLGFKGVQIGSHINNLNLDDPSFFPFYAACEELDMCIFVHPWWWMAKEKMDKYWLSWLVGMPMETSLAICSMIFSGVFQKFPKLRVALLMVEVLSLQLSVELSMDLMCVRIWLRWIIM